LLWLVPAQNRRPGLSEADTVSSCLRFAIERWHHTTGSG